MVLAVVTGCGPVNTVPAPVAATDPVQEYSLEIPANLEVRHVDFAATTFSYVSGTLDLASTAVGGRAFLKVYAVDRTSGESVLLLYENIARRHRPVPVIRFRAGSAPTPSASGGILPPDPGRDPPAR
jgi:hypothetical protein